MAMLGTPRGSAIWDYNGFMRGTVRPISADIALIVGFFLVGIIGVIFIVIAKMIKKTLPKNASNNQIEHPVEDASKTA